jgi:dipeptidase E
VHVYASSYRLCSNPSLLAALFEGSTRIAVINNALDFSQDHKRRETRLAKEQDLLEALGLEPQEVDLRKFFGSVHSLESAFEEFDGVWVVGGNAFILRRAMKQSGFDEFVRLKQKSSAPFVYAGYSAGACVLGATLKGIHLVDPTEIVPEGYEAKVEWSGLGILPFSIAPHFKSDHPESSQIDSVVEYFERHKIPYRALRDGESLVEYAV